MTDKRFTMEYEETYNDTMYLDDGDVMTEKEVLKTLNELHEENEQLKQSYKEFEDECQSTFNAMSRKQDDLYRKNFKLKEENKSWLKTASRMDTIHHEDREYCERIHRENEKLKQFQEQVASVIESKMGDNVCNGYKMEVLKEIWNELELDEVWFE